MLRFFGAIALSVFAVTAVHAEGARFCRSRFAPGEKIETRFLGIEYALMMHALAEKYCGAKPLPMEPKYLGYLERQGCDAKTEVHRDVKDSIRKLEGASLTLMAAGGDPNLPISEQQARDWARDAAEQLGGCRRLIQLQESDPN